ncbi:MAG: hypothetical protein JOZ72_16955 [Alphaproteobacteria bacterium]|nr:hypothetical protein [Alphaproteobacteria bacterium]
MSKMVLLAALAGLGAALAPAKAALVILPDTTQGVTCSGGICQSTTANAQLDVADLERLLSAGPVTVIGESQAQDIVVATPVRWASTSILTLKAYRSIVVQSSIRAEGKSGLHIVTNDGGQDGRFSITTGKVQFWDTGSDVVIDGDPYQLVNSVASIIAKSGDNMALANDYDAKPDGTYPHSPVHELDRHFEGFGNTISNLHVRDIANPAVGLFGTVYFGSVHNLNITNASVVAAMSQGDSHWVGILAGTVAGGNVRNVTVTGKVLGAGGGTMTAGGMIGNAGADTENLHADVSVKIRNQQGGYAGGLVGESHASLLRCSARGKVQGGTSANAGGLVGWNQGPIIQCFAMGNVTSRGPNHVTVGGLVATNSDKIYDSYASGNVTGVDGSIVGPLVGRDQPNFGIASTITASYALGIPKGGAGSKVGGVLGSDLCPAGSNKQVYWDTKTSGITDPSKGAGDVANDPGLMALSHSQLKSGLPAGFDPTVWAENGLTHGGLPFLIANRP